MLNSSEGLKLDFSNFVKEIYDSPLRRLHIYREQFLGVSRSLPENIVSFPTCPVKRACESFKFI